MRRVARDVLGSCLCFKFALAAFSLNVDGLISGLTASVGGVFILQDVVFVVRRRT